MGSSSAPQAQLYSSGGQNSGLMFGQPGADLSTFGTPGPGGKGANTAPNQVPTGTQAPTDRMVGFNPNQPMNGVYSTQNQQPWQGATVGPDILPAASQPIAQQIQPFFNGFGSSPWMLGGPMGGLASMMSPLGISPQWSSPFMSQGGKGIW